MFPTTIFVTIVFFISATVFASKCNRQRDDQMDVCGQRLLVIGYNETRRFPINDQQLNIHCSDLKASLKCVKSYSNECLETIDKPLLDMVQEGSANEIKKFCIDRQGRKDFVKHSHCYNRHILQLHKCMQSYVENLQLIPKAERSYKIPLTCCEHCKFRKCIEAAMNVTCDATDVQYMMKMVDGFAVTVYELMCGHITEEDEICDNLPEKTEEDKIVKSKSILSYFHIIYKSLLENQSN